MRYVTVLGLPIVGYELNMQTRSKKIIAQIGPLPVVVLVSYCAWEWCGESAPARACGYGGAKISLSL